MDNNNNTKKTIRLNGIEHWKTVSFYLVLYDAFAVTFSYFLALLLRFDFSFSRIPIMYFRPWLYFAPFYAVICIIVFWRLRLYRSIWRFASFTELQRISLATAITTVIHIIGVTYTLSILVKGTQYTVNRMPFSYYVMGAVFQAILITGIRFSYRFVLLLRATKAKNGASRIMLIGAGSAGQMILRDLRRTKAVEEQAVCFIDDNKNKWNRDVDGVLVVGGRDSIIDTVYKLKIDKIYIALPSISAKERKKIIDICRETDCEIKNLPGMYQLALGDVTVSALKNVDVEDLLGREPVKMNSKEVREFLSGKKVLITGGGGSIGSELCRQVAKVPNLEQLIIFDVYENNAHAIKLELMDKYPDLDLITLIGSVRNSRRVKQIFEEYRPDIVFHAAAHKHVPLMEDSPCEAIKNNVMGTYYTAYAAMAYNCEKFVLISTDKAVNPVNIMGASKRLCEMIVQSFAKKISEGKAREIPDMHTDSGTFLVKDDSAPSSINYTVIPPDNPRTEFVAVRFGNVLGSNGSVIPRFREQIQKGEAVTVTHPDIIRYFMTIPEAASLVLQAATFGGGGKIFVLDMGTPVKIDDLARNMIRLSGLKPDEDIPIVYTGLRPGEKLFEERLMDEEGLTKTSNKLINIGKPIPFDEDEFIKDLPRLFDAAYEDREDIRAIVEEYVSTYHPAGRHGTERKTEAYEKQMMELLAKKTERL